MEPRDDDLIASCLAGDRMAFSLLVTRYQGPVYRLAYGMVGHVEDAQDIVQESFYRAYRSLGTFRQGASFSAWILKIASNLCIDHLRKRPSRFMSLEAVAEQGREVAGDHPSPEEVYLQEERSRLVQQAMATLPEKYRLVLLLRHTHGMSVEEIACTLGQPQGTVKSHLFRARERLRRYLEEQGHLPHHREG